MVLVLVEIILGDHENITECDLVRGIISYQWLTGLVEVMIMK